ncbi:hypothetical protein WA026_009826 [Henosepilachna vigintioctopunctata]|uniref:Uncharacterized protein n=1 Tax=Henosepilachna vigintioctopunctata TaxID=420089 RepID=A0AAW1TQE6_9CUCU
MITNVAFAVICILHITAARHPRRSRHPQDPNLFLAHQELSPEITFSYEDAYDFSGISIPSHNSIEKPVDEPQEYVPPQSVGSASVPLQPPPAVPVNAVAANVPSNNGAVYLGSGSIGVVRLGNGAYALGSGSLGYSDLRSRPRPSANVRPSPIRASPNLIPAAIPGQPPIQPPTRQVFEYRFPLSDRSIQDTNTYELLRPDGVGFGTPVIRPPRPARMHFATATVPVRPSDPQYTLTITPEIPDSDPNQFDQFYYTQQ